MLLIRRLSQSFGISIGRHSALLNDRQTARNGLPPSLVIAEVLLVKPWPHMLSGKRFREGCSNYLVDVLGHKLGQKGIIRQAKSYKDEPMSLKLFKPSTSFSFSKVCSQ